jgi:hypothetical protein
MPSTSPSLLLLAGILLTLVPLGVALFEQHRRRRQLRRLAIERGCRLELRGSVELARRIIPHLPIGASDVRVVDLLTCDHGHGGQLAVARVDYALGSVRHRRDNTRILAFHRDSDGAVIDVNFADANRPRREQYEQLLK